MISSLSRIGLVAAALALAGCTESALQSAATSKQLPANVLDRMKAKGIAKNAPVMARIFKEEGKLEIWKQKQNGRYDIVAEYDICKWSGKLGPKFTEGDRQAPEGFYTVRPGAMNPNSNYHLSFNIGYPNAYDRANGRTGSNLMVHGACSSSGCYSMTDAQVEEIYAFARDAFQGGQTDFQIQAFPFRMTAQNMARYSKDSNYEFWKMLKVGYDHFEITKVPPKVDVCEKRYVFNQVPEGTATFNPTGACPPMTQPDTLTSAYRSYQKQYDIAFASSSNSFGKLPPKPTIAGPKEAHVVADWTKKRAKGERVTIEPPTLAADGTVVATTDRMGRIDSAAGRRMAALEAAEAEKKRIAEEKAAAIAMQTAQAEAAKLAAAQAAEAEKAAKAAEQEALAAAAAKPAEAARPAEAVAPQTADARPAAPARTPIIENVGAAPAADSQAAPGGVSGIIGNVRKRFGNIFGS